MGNPRQLSDPARVVWAKSHVDPHGGGALDGWLPLHQHLDDTAEIAARLWDHWLPASLKRSLALTFGSPDAARSLVVWLAGTHDVGKASPAFAVQVPQLAEPMQSRGLTIDSRIIGMEERRSARHEIVSFLAIRRWLQEQHSFGRAQAQQLASVAAAHHGNPATTLAISAIEPRKYLVGAGTWEDVRHELLASADAQWSDAASASAWREATIAQPTLVLLSSLVIVADWLASSDLFPPARLGEQATAPASERAESAWRRLGFPSPWSASPPTTDAAELLAMRFDLPPDADPRPAQIAMVEQALRAETPGLMILEAEMGSGKTEAALLAAEILAARFGLGGVFVGLPTRATADGMFGRVLTWAQRLGLDTPSGIYLAHSSAMLNPRFDELSRIGYFQSIGGQPGARDDSGEETAESVVAHRWFAAPRRGPLADFVIGTVDQALFAGHRSRYLMLRHLALASKVVIIDEAHAYDDYMSTYLTRVLEWLGAYEAPVIMLSATLPSSRRRAFHDAYARGRRSLPDSPRSAEAPREADLELLEGAIGYPVISASSGTGEPVVAHPAASASGRTVAIERIADDDETLVKTVADALSEGGNLAIIRNTVRRAQDTAALLRARFPDIPLVVGHSHFLAIDRARKDRELLERYGPTGNRPQTSIVVATQVIEQSLDVDFDIMISDVAPIDLLLQRLGRLHRHQGRDRPAPVRHPRLILTGVDETTTPPTPDGGAARVYGLAILLRTLAVLDGRAALEIPEDIAPLVEAVYSEDADLIRPSWRGVYDQAEKERIRARADQLKRSEDFALPHLHSARPHLLGWLGGPDVDPELNLPGRATVRDSDGETLEVIVLQRGEGGVLYTPGWLGIGGGQQIPDNEPPSHTLTRTILGCKIRIPVGMCRGDAIRRHITALERSFELPTWHASHLLKGELVLVFDGSRRARLNEYALTYDPEDGLRFTRQSAPGRPGSIDSLTSDDGDG